jgi:5-methylthioadenosine/S-adenosylhomocysteine deaminase
LLLTARWVFLDPEHRLEGGGVFVARGRVVAILANRPAVARFERREGIRALDLGERALVPGFVDAHAHLELSLLGEGKLPDRGSFTDWIRALLAARRTLSRADLRRAALLGAGRLLTTGTTTVGDIDSTGNSESALRESPLRARIYREVLDAGDADRASAALTRAARPFARSSRLHPGLSPHAPYTVGSELLRSTSDLSSRRGWPGCVHWAETEEEVEFLAAGSGPMRSILERTRRSRRARPRTGLELLADAGWLSPRLALVHGNHPAPGDVERVARSGAALVHCPGTHAYFGRDRFALQSWLDAGVTVALGTDGLSSNRDLDMRRELSLLRESHPWLSAERAFDMATRAGARALGLTKKTGEIALGSRADLCAHGFSDLSQREGRSPRVLLEALTRGRSTADAVWIEGRQALASPEFQRRLSDSSGRIAE